MKKVIILIITIALFGAGFYGYKAYREDKNAWKIEITNDYVNVREGHAAIERNIGKVKKGETYKVLDIYLEDDSFVWYKVKISKDKTGWVASSRTKPYVQEINNPNKTESEDYVIDYGSPIIKYYDEYYNAYDLSSISYDHLEIEDESDYTIKHYVYYEEEPIDKDTPQYWIEYIVTDEAGNTSSKVQGITFEVEPSRNDVLDFSVLEGKRS